MNARRAVAVAALLLLAPGISACSNGFNEQTDKVYNPAVGVSDRSSTVYVLNAMVVSGTDGSGTVIAGLANNDQTHSVKLTGVEGVGAQSGAQVKLGGQTTIPPGGYVNLANQAQIEIRDKGVVAGKLVKLRFTFDRGQPVTLDMPVVSASDPAYSGIAVPG